MSPRATSSRLGYKNPSVVTTFHGGPITPTGDESLKDPSSRALADSDTAGNADHVRDVFARTNAKRRSCVAQLAAGHDVQLQQTSEGDVDLLDLVQREGVVNTLECHQLVGTEPGQSRDLQLSPGRSLHPGEL